MQVGDEGRKGFCGGVVDTDAGVQLEEVISRASGGSVMNCPQACVCHTNIVAKAVGSEGVQDRSHDLWVLEGKCGWCRCAVTEVPGVDEVWTLEGGYTMRSVTEELREEVKACSYRCACHSKIISHAKPEECGVPDILISDVNDEYRCTACSCVWENTGCYDLNVIYCTIDGYSIKMMEPNVLAMIAVSYTHLTLPTICSV